MENGHILGPLNIEILWSLVSIHNNFPLVNLENDMHRLACLGLFSFFMLHRTATRIHLHQIPVIFNFTYLTA